ncbi:MAG: class I SAM-dependent methyltransferase [Pseudomonadota bacterium]
MASFATLYSIPLENFTGKRVLDVGCWTGDTSLLLAQLAAEVVAIEEVKKYADTVNFLAAAFGISKTLSALPHSIYDFPYAEYSEYFDIVYFPGVVYHLSDPVLAMRILYNSIKLGGEIYIESQGIDSEEPFCRFDGSFIYHVGDKDSNGLNRGGWKRFTPSPSALKRMVREAGFDDIHITWDKRTKRVFGYARKIHRRGICKAGLSVRSMS